MAYIFLTLDAIQSFASTRQFQSSEYDESRALFDILTGHTSQWNYRDLFFTKTLKGGYFYTSKPNLNKGIIFDFDTFDGFQNRSEDECITIFQKVLKYSIRYFEGLPLVTCERLVPDTNTTLVYPFPFVATKDVYKILIERNLGKFDRKGKQFLVVFGIAKDESYKKAQATNLNKAVSELQGVCLSIPPATNTNVTPIETISITELTDIDLSIDSTIGIEKWNYFLTKKQKEFINSNINGAERLEGAAGTGKTLTMILRCINTLKLKDKQNEEFHIAFITHTISTKEQILNIFKANCSDIDKYLDKDYSNISLSIITLQEWCIQYLGGSLSSNEYLDRDAMESKELQLLYIEQAYSHAISTDFKSYKSICSDKFISFIEKTSINNLFEMLQHEIAVTIKGRANENLDCYKQLPRLQYSIPCSKEGDLAFLFLIFQYYQKSLQETGQFDSDDIILTALGQLNTPIWRRRRNKEGYNALFIDETHMFNLNELSIFHFLNKENCKQNIIFAIDKSQALGDRGLNDTALSIAFELDADSIKDSHKLNTVFRSSPDIVNLAFNILSSGATLFTTFDNPLIDAKFNFTEQEEKKCIAPHYILKENDSEMISYAFYKAESIHQKHNIQRSKILLIASNEHLLTSIQRSANESNKPIEILKSRGDTSIVKQATRNGRFVLSLIDFVGGLEFDAVIIIGVDKGRVPASSESIDSFLFSNYTWHNKMYVAITRGKYIVYILGDKSRGESDILENAIQNGLLITSDN
ncbi:UvrD-helicase domain-containing protein [Bacteroides xylanisolvens]|uniref:UvrD-helicase domain-containing protein n=1 Tax=Bacteroides xylanisolvens TaxID=371601 RepID=UPI001CDD705E|nr:UvrD-helicase domain-containing protein [Bacteroides xylanisolvens]MCA4563308.1 UvrD-helicase domain-containing protein [Bacteroides xylanisolvens]